MHHQPMLSPKIVLPPHGGDLAWAASTFPSAPTPWIDLSTGINPWSYSVEAEPAEWSRLPSPLSLEALIVAARRYYRISPDAAVVPVAGIELAIRLLPYFLRPHGSVHVVGPTYSSHGDAWRSAGCAVRIVGRLEDVSPNCGVGVVVSPNNPDGRVTTPGAIAEWAETLRRQGGYLIADRSFADVEEMPAALAPSDGLIELRSFGKFFGLPGLRLGFVIGAEKVLGPFARALGAWPVNAAAIKLGCEALADDTWQSATRARLRAQGDALRADLRPHGKLLGGTDLFQLLQVQDAAALFHHLAARGILARIFDYDHRWIRFGLPRDEAASARLTDALMTFSRATS